MSKKPKVVYTPWYLAQAGTEHAEQSALFAWLNCAAQYGTGPANHADTYAKETRGEVLEAFKVTGGWYGPIPMLRYVFAIHNQGHGDAIRGGRARAEGVKAGAPDICVPITAPHYAGLYIELKKLSVKPKREGKGGVADVQSDFHRFLISQRYCVEVCYGWQEARDCIKWYLGI